ncbi:MAG: sodium:calcium antiporter, partial [Gammaproteobacteria bacterium]|nr:sodium:calcium antiporter [Gammaproteobacteria bacterium]
GTSMPDLVVNVVSAFRGETELAFGNIVGSNIANLALVLGASALLMPLTLHGSLVQREVPLLLLGTTVLTVLALDSVFEGTPSYIGTADSLVLLLLFCVFIYIMVRDVLRVHHQDAIVTDIESNPIINPGTVSRLSWLFVLIGLVLLYAGGEMTVRFSIRFADRFDLPIAQVGLFIVAIGTSMPELVTSAIAAVRKESDLAVGNLVGSNIFNSLLVLPASGLASSIAVPQNGVVDLMFSWALAALLIPVFIFGKAKLGRVAGATMLSAYVVWIVVRIG